ncbi:MAG: hypothetical protein QM762_22365 [Chryseolinea sp.]
MRELTTNISFGDTWEGIGRKINNHLANLDRNASDDKQKILELCQIGKLLCSYFDDFDIVKVSESPDFLISNGDVSIGLEHQLILDPETKAKEGFYDNIFSKVEHNLIKDETVPNFLINLIIKKDADLMINNKGAIINRVTEILREFVLIGLLSDNDFILSAHKMRHSRKSINANYGGHLQRSIDKELILEFLKKKEGKIESYKRNSGPNQWLVLVIGGLGESSYEVANAFELLLDTQFNKVLLYEDFSNRLFELK